MNSTLDIDVRDIYRRIVCGEASELSTSNRYAYSVFKVIKHAKCGMGIRGIERDVYRAVSMLHPVRVRLVAEYVLRRIKRTPLNTSLVVGWYPCGLAIELINLLGVDLTVVEDQVSVFDMESRLIDRIFPNMYMSLLKEGRATTYFTHIYSSPNDVEAARGLAPFDLAVVCSPVGRGIDAIGDVLRMSRTTVLVEVVRSGRLGPLLDSFLALIGRRAPSVEEARTYARRWNAEDIELYADLYLVGTIRRPA